MKGRLAGLFGGRAAADVASANASVDAAGVAVGDAGQSVGQAPPLRSLLTQLSDRISPRLLAMDPRALAALLAGVLLFVALECWMLVLRAPLAEWRLLVDRRDQALVTQVVGPSPSDIQRTQQALAQAEQALQAAVLPHADDDMVLQLIATLDRIGQRHGVSLGQVQAGARRSEGDVQIASFDGEARGSYLALINWLSEAETQIAPLQATELKLSSSDEGRQVSLRVKFTAYLPIPAASGASK